MLVINLLVIRAFTNYNNFEELSQTFDMMQPVYQHKLW